MVRQVSRVRGLLGVRRRGESLVVAGVVRLGLRGWVVVAGTRVWMLLVVRGRRGVGGVLGLYPGLGVMGGSGDGCVVRKRSTMVVVPAVLSRNWRLVWLARRRELVVLVVVLMVGCGGTWATASPRRAVDAVERLWRWLLCGARCEDRGKVWRPGCVGRQVFVRHVDVPLTNITSVLKPQIKEQKRFGDFLALSA